MNMLRTILISSTILLIFFSAACKKNDFRSSSIEIHKLLSVADSMVKEAKRDTVSDEEKGHSIRILFDKSESKKYLHTNKQIFDQYYGIIKNNVEKNNTHYVDALYIFAHVNALTYFFTDESITDNCKYLEMIKKEKNAVLSKWVQDEIFGPFMNFSETDLNRWRNMKADDKQEKINQYLMTYYYQLHKCDVR